MSPFIGIERQHYSFTKRALHFQSEAQRIQQNQMGRLALLCIQELDFPLNRLH